MSLPADKEARKSLPIMSGFLDYFPDAAAMVAYVSKVGNDQHNPGQEMHWSRGKSADHVDALIRHLMERGKIDVDGLPHSAKAAWRAMALLQEELEAHGAELARGARFDPPTEDVYEEADLNPFKPFGVPGDGLRDLASREAQVIPIGNPGRSPLPDPFAGGERSGPCVPSPVEPSPLKPSRGNVAGRKAPVRRS